MLLCKYTLSILMLMPRRHYSPTPHPALNSLSHLLSQFVFLVISESVSVSSPVDRKK